MPTPTQELPKPTGPELCKACGKKIDPVTYNCGCFRG